MEKFTFFYRTESPFSQWHPALFEIDGVYFNCAEQYMMYQKAMLFNDAEIAAQILSAQTPREQKELGRAVRNFHREQWETNCKQFVYEGNYAKFTQNQQLLESLLVTQGTTLVEASPTDRIWGVGLSEDDPRILKRETWRGTNWLGEVLTELREDLFTEMNK
ncbi:NADAR family protein [Paenibacillus oryzisoli]|uniref:GTP cyclohydrolase n=1 Tax=Paenibacillus oryzisoli TaxID=1850517 RepID=A0A197ZX76_9BACL|nr:NADAR family protein [Paenibacillus oryzisoli]OAS13333.1 GTP cyclohydrolase [Paenibacillus oryzisoli]